MATSIPTANPSFHCLSGNQKIGKAHTAILVATDYAGTITEVTRINQTYWSVTTREVKGAFSNPKVGVTAHVWVDNGGQWVADYHTHALGYVEAGRAWDVRAALAIAIDSTTRRGHDAGRW